MAHMKRRIVSILRDQTMGTEEKIHILRQWEADSLSKERSATEGMGPVDGDDGEDLHAIEIALRKLGQQPVTGGAATL
ncbi:MAG TPA: hypothetical protein GYA10_17160 [Alphaproteobacteria bacterium]|nr:hypothetical protein [Alphaproteobacteria bacterium]